MHIEIYNTRGELIYRETGLHKRANTHDLSDMRFDNANLPEADLSGYKLAWSLFRRSNLRGARFAGTDMTWTDFTEADLTGADFRGARLGRDIDFSKSILKDTLFDFDIPVVEKLHSKIPLDLVDMRHWHNDCGTSHCHAGWAVHLAGEAGYDLENLIGPAAAGALIINKSCPYLNGQVPSFHGWDGDAIEAIQNYARIEQG